MFSLFLALLIGALLALTAAVLAKEFPKAVPDGLRESLAPYAPSWPFVAAMALVILTASGAYAAGKATVPLECLKQRDAADALVRGVDQLVRANGEMWTLVHSLEGVRFVRSPASRRLVAQPVGDTGGPATP